MGANIGTSVTNTIVSLGTHHEADRVPAGGVGGAVMHDYFNQ